MSTCFALSLTPRYGDGWALGAYMELSGAHGNVILRDWLQAGFVMTYDLSCGSSDRLLTRSV